MGVDVAHQRFRRTKAGRGGLDAGEDDQDGQGDTHHGSQSVI
jgi:hypothetical protein